MLMPRRAIDYDKPIEKRIQALLALSRQHAEAFRSPANSLARQRYLALHPTNILVMKCMDGRIHIPHATRTPLGIMTPFRNLGGIFDLGWPYLGELVSESVTQAARRGSASLLIITYHFSQGAMSRGCAGFGCNTAKAYAHACQLARQAEAMFGHERRQVYPLVCGFETDCDALVVHGPEDQQLNTRDWVGQPPEALAQGVQKVCPDMPAHILHDVMPLLEGNLAHQASLLGIKRKLDIEHREWVICLGRGFDFLHLPNTALIIGPYGPDLAGPVSTAAAIVENNMQAGRIPDDGFMLLASSPYHQHGVDRARAELKSRFLSDFAVNLIGERHPHLLSRLRSYTAVVHWPTRQLESLPSSGREWQIS